MAKPITHIDKKIPTKMEEQAESLSEILSLIAKNKEAITTSLEILQELHSAGVLDILKGLLKTREKVGVLAIQQINQPNMHNTIKNGINMLQLVGEMEPDRLKTVFHAAKKGLESMEEAHAHEKIGVWGLLKQMKDPDVLASLSTMTGFLQGMGKELNNQKPLH